MCIRVSLRVARRACDARLAPPGTRRLVSGDTSARPVDVAVGVVIREDGAFLLAQRPVGKPMAGYWEFPGGKLEPGEPVFEALVREFDEELGLAIRAAHPWAQRVVVYPHATVRLHFWRSFGARGEWAGDPESREGQAFRWERIAALSTDPWLPGALPVKRWLQLPACYAISDATTMGIDAFVAALDARIADGSLEQLQLREPALDPSSFQRLFDMVRGRCGEAGVRLLVNGVHPQAFWARAHGVHLRARDLMAATRRPDVPWCLASCHAADELAHAGALGVDAVVLGPVRPTATHPDRDTIGWEGFARAVATTAIPVYALGGLGPGDLDRAIDAGAHGVAMIRGAWATPA